MTSRSWCARIDGLGRIVPVLITLVTVGLAVPLAWAIWDAYMGAPWTRDGTVRVYVVTMAPEVAGRIVGLPVADNKFVNKGDLLMMIDPRDYRIAVSRTEAAEGISGIKMPTTRRVYAYDENGQKIPDPLLVSIDIETIVFS
jgi:multidrug efflux pump subunit AcrA (membrane-fusion protein)